MFLIKDDGSSVPGLTFIIGLGEFLSVFVVNGIKGVSWTNRKSSILGNIWLFMVIDVYSS